MGKDYNTVGDAFDKFLERRNHVWPWLVIAASFLYVAARFIPWAAAGFPIPR